MNFILHPSPGFLILHPSPFILHPTMNQCPIHYATIVLVEMRFSTRVVHCSRQGFLSCSQKCSQLPSFPLFLPFPSADLGFQLYWALPRSCHLTEVLL